ncbi:MAG TPA: 1,4-dihydroxy-6-naphthoate synthase [Thermodesulfovibrionales bacterium]|nr:1,4-dihydroxy-6-naphthoate synthase [Thermodesulfovibrionales bacterium]
MNTLTLGYSPCPNDTYIFYALVHGRIDTEGLAFAEILEDVETLNQMARQAKLDITKVSFHAFARLRDTYCLLRSGGALGKGCGPLVIAREALDMKDLRGRTIAIPGDLTTAFLLLQVCDPELKNNVKVMPFHRIIDAVKQGDAEAGLIIHESRFTYQREGLIQVIDLGAWWEKETGLPIPLGCIIARRELGPVLVQKTDRLIRNSLTYAFDHRDETREYIKNHAQELDDSVIDQHIQLYVNDYSLDIGEDGVRAVQELFRRATGQGIVPPSSLPLFLS